MSIIVAVEKSDEICVATDTVAFDGTHLQAPDLVVNSSKARRVGQSIVGCVGYAIYENILDHIFGSMTALPDFCDSNAVFDFFLKFMDKLCKQYHFLGEQVSADEDEGGSPFVKLESRFLIANRHGIFVVDSDLTVVQYRKFWAIGSGCCFALGALHSIYDSDMSASEIAMCAAEAAIRFDESCRGSVEILNVD
jgi:ATP-dependent protease HslVU (ClpYQ) peptidase subunit